MARWGNVLGLSASAKNPTVISNQQNDDKSLSQRNMSGSPGTYESIIADSTVLTPVPDFCVLRVTNTAAAVAYLFVGAAADAPGGAPAIATGIAIPPNSTDCIFIGKLASDKDSVMVKSSASTLQVAICEQ